MLAASDTSEDARRHLDELLRKMTPAQKFRRVRALSAIVRSLALTRMAEQYPEASLDDLRRRLALDLLPPDLASIMRERARR